MSEPRNAIEGSNDEAPLDIEGITLNAEDSAIFGVVQKKNKTINVLYGKLKAVQEKLNLEASRARELQETLKTKEGDIDNLAMILTQTQLRVDVLLKDSPPDLRDRWEVLKKKWQNTQKWKATFHTKMKRIVGSMESQVSDVRAQLVSTKDILQRGTGDFNRLCQDTVERLKHLQSSGDLGVLDDNWMASPEGAEYVPKRKRTLCQPRLDLDVTVRQLKSMNSVVGKIVGITNSFLKNCKIEASVTCELLKPDVDPAKAQIDMHVTVLRNCLFALEDCNLAVGNTHQQEELKTMEAESKQLQQEVRELTTALKRRRSNSQKPEPMGTEPMGTEPMGTEVATSPVETVQGSTQTPNTLSKSSSKSRPPFISTISSPIADVSSSSVGFSHRSPHLAQSMDQNGPVCSTCSRWINPKKCECVTNESWDADLHILNDVVSSPTTNVEERKEAQDILESRKEIRRLTLKSTLQRVGAMVKLRRLKKNRISKAEMLASKALHQWLEKRKEILQRRHLLLQSTHQMLKNKIPLDTDLACDTPIESESFGTNPTNPTTPTQIDPPMMPAFHPIDPARKTMQGPGAASSSSSFKLTRLQHGDKEKGAWRRVRSLDPGTRTHSSMRDPQYEGTKPQDRNPKTKPEPESASCLRPPLLQPKRSSTPNNLQALHRYQDDNDGVYSQKQVPGRPSSVGCVPSPMSMSGNRALPSKISMTHSAAEKDKRTQRPSTINSIGKTSLKYEEMRRAVTPELVKPPSPMDFTCKNSLKYEEIRRQSLTLSPMDFMGKNSLKSEEFQRARTPEHATPMDFLHPTDDALLRSDRAPLGDSLYSTASASGMGGFDTGLGMSWPSGLPLPDPNAPEWSQHSLEASDPGFRPSGLPLPSPNDPELSQRTLGPPDADSRVPTERFRSKSSGDARSAHRTQRPSTKQKLRPLEANFSTVHTKNRNRSKTFHKVQKEEDQLIVS